MQSLSTPVITAALMTLVDEGRVNLDDNVTDYLPYFSDFRVYRSGTTEATLETVPLGIQMTIRHLLTHTWGFPGQRFMESSSPEIRMVLPHHSTLAWARSRRVLRLQLGQGGRFCLVQRLPDR